jgi:hypothetical protein
VLVTTLEELSGLLVRWLTHLESGACQKTYVMDGLALSCLLQPTSATDSILMYGCLLDAVWVQA